MRHMLTPRHLRWRKRSRCVRVHAHQHLCPTRLGLRNGLRRLRRNAQLRQLSQRSILRPLPLLRLVSFELRDARLQLRLDHGPVHRSQAQLRELSEPRVVHEQRLLHPSIDVYEQRLQLRYGERRVRRDAQLRQLSVRTGLREQCLFGWLHAGDVRSARDELRHDLGRMWWNAQLWNVQEGSYVRQQRVPVTTPVAH